VTKLREFDQGELERLRRIRECHEADRLSEREVARAVAQFGVRGAARSRRRAARVVWLAAAGLLLALGAVAASGVLKLQPISAGVKPEVASGVAQGEPVRRVGSEQKAPRLEQAPLREVSPPTEAPALAESARRAMLAAPRSQRALEVVTAEVASDGAGRAWAQAAEALKRGDHSTAQQALSELSRSEDATTRDAALLAQAELDLGTGNAARARAVLGELAERGATPFVQKRARQILAQKN
jgi:hypothetical protein